MIQRKKKVEERKKGKEGRNEEGEKKKRKLTHLSSNGWVCDPSLDMVFVNCVSHGKSLKRVSQGRKFLLVDKGLNSLEDYLRGLF